MCDRILKSPTPWNGSTNLHRATRHVCRTPRRGLLIVRQMTYEEKQKARRKLRWAVLSGKVKRQPCEKCGSLPSFAHHIDYSKPLDVTWLCRKHHGEAHSIYPKQKTCAVCGKIFTPHKAKRKRDKTCSWNCRCVLVKAAVIKRMQTPESREKYRQLAYENGGYERAKTMVLHRWKKRKWNQIELPLTRR